MQILAAPIQEYTDAAFRNAHFRTIGGIDEYYIPFVRVEQGGLSKHAEREIDRSNNRFASTVPQMLVKNAAEARVILSRLSHFGYERVDLNLGCPFPKVVKGGYGAGLLSSPQVIREVLEEAGIFSGIRISVKMRLGAADSGQWRDVLPILNDFPLDKIVLHPRTAVQQYGGVPDKEAFFCFQQECRHPLFYNGDIRNAEDAGGLDCIMIGRGLLANPLLARQLRGDNVDSSLLTDFHSAYVEECVRLYQQPLLKLKILWDYFLPDVDKRLRKAIQKSTTLQEYQANAALMQKFC